ncbi:hypothetical protein KMZ68_19435 [Bradyrhizobium sediminis]|uniref:Uncharacterized protein n=1 Tax=Bradyrhizobium sediminis TaxID=2840469 RepID=A0A975NMB0_9BRAD|nr:hypothetical protein [Bradyrhizobium sediminis]QWG17136.1 hypothetical protein KMZ68_19435 [Bradyrhizobium sediminis]
MSNRIFYVAGRAALGALFLCVAPVTSARGDFGSCIANASAFVVELDNLLLREENRLAPYDDLNERSFPLHDCETDALLEVVKRSRFIRLIDYNPLSKKYFIYFSSDYMRASFTYLVPEKRSTFKTASRVHK